MDIGGGTTEIALISLGGFAAARSLRTAGDRFTATLGEHLLTRHSLHLGLSQVERLKHELGNLAPGATIPVAGRDARSGKPVHAQLDGDEGGEHPRLAQGGEGLARESGPGIDLGGMLRGHLGRDAAGSGDEFAARWGDRLSGRWQWHTESLRGTTYSATWAATISDS